MNDNQSNAHGKDKSSNNLPENHPEDCFCKDCMILKCPKLGRKSEQGASESDAASDVVKDCFNKLPFEHVIKQRAKSCNTAPSNLQSPLLATSGIISTGGLDYLSLSMYGRFSNNYNSLFEVLSRAQIDAQEDPKFGGFLELSNGITVLVNGSGKGRGFSFAKWKFKYQGIEFAIANRQISVNFETGKEHPNLYVDISSSPLMAYGEKNVMEKVEEVFDAIEYSSFRASPSRADLCVDFANVPVSHFYNAINNNCYVTRTRKKGFIYGGNGVETIQIGGKGADTLLRIYDKYVECKDDLEKYKLLKFRRWGIDPDLEIGATRVEFQLRRNHLRDQHSIFTYDDLVRKRKSLVRKLTYDWFRITEEEPDIKHTERFGPSKLWSEVIQAFDAWTGPEYEHCEKHQVVGADPRKLLLQAIGCFISILALEGKIPDSEEQLMDEIRKLIKHELERMCKEIKLRRLKFEAENPYLIIDKDKKKSA